jgi:tetratricopeptide (TPR) repeat protein
MSSTAAAIAKQPGVSNQPSRLFISGEKQRTVLCLVLVLLTLAFYNSAGRNNFTNYDDTYYVTNNPHVQAGLTWETVKWAFTSFDDANWHPLTWLSHALDCQLFKLNPAGPHYVSVLLHAANVVLLFLVLAAATGFTWPSFMVAGLFALHPINVQSVAWISERKNVLSMLFFLLALYAYGWYVRRESVKRYTVVASLFAIGLMAKPEIITLPFVLLLWDYWPLRRMFAQPSADPLPDAPRPHSFSFLVMEKLPLLLLSAASAIVTFFAQNKGEAVRRAPAWVRFGNVPLAYVRYLGKAFWPVHFAAFYPHPGRFLQPWKIVVSSIVVVVLTAVVLHFRERRYLIVGWFWFLGTLVPVSGVVQVGMQAMADRYAYLSFIGLFIAVSWTVAGIAEERKISIAWIAVPSALVLLTLGILCTREIPYWHDSETLWRHTLSITEGNYTAHDSLGRVLAEKGRMQEAQAEFDAAYELHNYSVSELLEIGTYQQIFGYPKEAAIQYRRALDNAPDAKFRSTALTMLGSAFTQTGNLDRARLSYTYALQENPENSAALVSSGLLAERDGKYDEAADQISHAMKIAPTDGGYLLLSQALRRTGRSQEADAAYAHAQQISHDFPKAQQIAKQVLLAAGIKAD